MQNDLELDNAVELVNKTLDSAASALIFAEGTIELKSAEITFQTEFSTKKGIEISFIIKLGGKKTSTSNSSVTYSYKVSEEVKKRAEVEKDKIFAGGSLPLTAFFTGEGQSAEIKSHLKSFGIPKASTKKKDGLYKAIVGAAYAFIRSQEIEGVEKESFTVNLSFSVQGNKKIGLNIEIEGIGLDGNYAKDKKIGHSIKLTLGMKEK